MYKSEKMDFTEMSLKTIIIFYSLSAHCVLAPGVCVCVHALSCVQLFAAPWTIAHQAPLSTEFSRQEY